MAAASAEIPVSKITAFRGLPGRGQSAFNAFLLVVLVESFLLLTAIVNPALLPGNWVPLIPDMEYYVLASFLALFVIVLLKEFPPGTNTLETFLARFACGAGITWVVVTLLFYTTVHTTPLSGGTKLEYLGFTGFFIAPVEELLFRAALPSRFGWFFGSVVFFAAFHVPVYLIQSPGSAPITLEGFLGVIIQPALMGVVLWFAYRMKPPVVTIRGKRVELPFGGLPFSTGIHFVYDAFVYGAILGLPLLAVAGLGLTPI